MTKLKAIAERLQGGSDRERDEGHKLWLIVTEIDRTGRTNWDLVPRSNNRIENLLTSES